MKAWFDYPLRDETASFGYSGRKIREQLIRHLDIVENSWDAQVKIWWGYWPSGPYQGLPTRSKHMIWYLVCESQFVSQRWVKSVNKSLALFVPSQFCADAYRNSGVKVPIYIINLGVDPDEHPFIERNHMGQPFTFLWQGVNQTKDRKGGWIAEQVFKELNEELRDQGLSDARLIIKTVPYSNIPIDIEDEKTKIRFVTKRLTLEQMQELDEQADCFIWPTRCEGFGLLPLEKMSTGMPCIVTSWSGQMDYLKPRYYLPLNYTWQESCYGKAFGQDAKPDEAHLLALMWYAYSYPTTMKAMGRQASAYVRQDWTWERTYEQLGQAFEEVLPRIKGHGGRKPNLLKRITGPYSCMKRDARYVRFRLMTSLAVQFCNLNIKSKILDIGCAENDLKRYWREVKQFKPSYVGIDKEGRKRVNFIKMDFDGQDLPFEDKEFDIIFCLDVIEHIQNPDYLISEMKRVSNAIVLDTPNANNVIWDNMQADPTHVKEFTINNLDRWGFHIAGFCNFVGSAINPDLDSIGEDEAHSTEIYGVWLDSLEKGESIPEKESPPGFITDDFIEQLIAEGSTS